MSGFTPDFNVSIVKQKINIKHPKVGQSLKFINHLTIKMSKHITFVTEDEKCNPKVT